MKKLILLILLFSANSFAGFSPACSTGKMGFYKTKEMCEFKSAVDCYEFQFGKNCAIQEVVDEQVNDYTKPNSFEAKSSVVTCSAIIDDVLTTEIDETKSQEQDCLEKEVAQVCDSLTKHYKVRLEDNSEVYCTKILGYEQKLTGFKIVQVNQVKKATYEAAQLTLKQKQLRKSLRSKARVFGNDLIDEITIRNEDKYSAGTLNLIQIDQLTTMLGPIISALQIGSVPTAKAKILGLAIDGSLVTQDDIDFAIGKIDAFLAL